MVTNSGPSVAEQTRIAHRLLIRCVCGHTKILHHGRNRRGHCWAVKGCPCRRFKPEGQTSDEETKNTIRYKEATKFDPPCVGTLYVSKAFLGGNPPKQLKVTIEAET